MSKHDLYSKIEEIARYYREEDYRACAELAENVDWQRVKSWDALAMMTDAYESLGEYENARDMSILAYNRNLGGKKLVYRLTELLIKTGDLEEAEDTFNEYCSMSGNAPDSYILEYHLLKEKNAPDKELIRVLEEFKEAGPDERYMYRLAELYAKNGEKEKCAETCDNIALWFKDGDFAEGAVKLKKKVGAELSPEQEKLFEAATVKDEDLKKTSKVDFKGQIDSGISNAAASSKIGKGAAATVAGAAAGGAVASGAAGKLKNLVKNVFNDEEFDEMTGEIPVDEVRAAADDKKEHIKDTADTEKKDVDKEIKENLSAEVKEELKAESALRGDGVYEGEKPMEGQVNMTDWMTDVREKKGQSTKEYSKSELDRILEEKDEKSKAYDRLMAEQKKLAESSGKPFNEASAKRKVEMQMAVDAARRDLDIRTGKGTAKQEAAAVAQVHSSPEKEQTAQTKELFMQETPDGNSDRTGKKAKIQDEDVLSAVLESAGAEAATLENTDPSERINRIECAVLSRLGVELSDDDKSEGSNAPKDVVDAATLLVKYISGTLRQLSKAEYAQGTPKRAQDTPKQAQETVKQAQDTPKQEQETVKRAQDTPKQAQETVKQAQNAPKQAQVDSLKNTKEPDTTQSTLSSSKGTAAAGGLVAAGGVLHEKAEKAKEVFSGKALRPHELEALKEIQGTKISGSATETLKEAKKSTDAVIAEESVKAADAVKKEKSTRDTVKIAAKAKIEAIKAEVKQESSAQYEEKPEIKTGDKEEIRSELKQEIKTGRIDKKTGKPDISKMRMKDITDDHIVANLSAEEAKVAESKMTQDEAADVIQKRITAPLDTAAVEKAVAASENSEINIKDEDTFTDTAHIDKQTLREIIEASENDEEAEGKNTRRFDTTAKQDTAQLDNVLREDLSKGKRGKIKAMFDEYYDMPEIDAQIEEYIAALPTEITREDSRNGNIIIAGAESVDKTGLAKTLAKAVNISYPKRKKKVIKTTGDNLNQYGFVRSADKLRGTFLVIENVGRIKPEVVDEMVDVMSKNTDRMIVIAEDTDDGIESFMNTNPALAKLFNHRINMRPFTTDELVAIAKDLSAQKGFSIDHEGELALYLEIDELRTHEPKVTIDDMDALTDDAIAHARKRIKKETGVSPKRQDESVCVLTNEDFRY